MPSVGDVPVSLIAVAVNPAVPATGTLVSIVKLALAVDVLTLPATSVMVTVTSGVPSANRVPLGSVAVQRPVLSAVVLTVTPANRISIAEPASALPANTGLATLVMPSVELNPESLSTPPTEPDAIPTVGTLNWVSSVKVNGADDLDASPLSATRRKTMEFDPSAAANVARSALNDLPPSILY